MAPKQRNSAGLKRLIAFWSRYCTLDSFHVQWIHRRAEIIRVRRGDVLCYQGELQRNLFFVLEGVLAKTTTRQHLGRERRRILRIALPNAGLSTTPHLYSRTASNGNIVALRSGTALRLPYKAVLELKLAEPAIGTLVDILNNKEKQQLMLHLHILHSTAPFERYLLFAEHLPDIRRATTQQEQADFLGISRDTVQKAQKYLLSG